MFDKFDEENQALKETIREIYGECEGCGTDIEELLEDEYFVNGITETILDFILNYEQGIPQPHKTEEISNDIVTSMSDPDILGIRF